ncbi:hypothetical protein KDU71_17850 [Carboxylicivirga sediminis]|uniref:Type IX secretion system membrane protein PorP/SprF n=1 Tax=Carboxylicivirga sediminis TaxID=2006564 RepID=A0A941F6Q4_9BACT|nr:hypothetical protein [Carboxylicivirga sediminis]MBR8537437.1 hypothetical protein [Carboxylicivirga sediminis]
MNRLTLTFCVAVLTGALTFAQTIDYSGPVSAALGFTKVFDNSSMSGLNNVANLASFEHYAVGAAYQMRFNMDEMSARAATLVAPTRLGTFGGVIFQSGYSKSNYSRYAFSYSRLFGEKVSAGLQFNYLTHQIEGADPANSFYTSLGFNFLISEQWAVGVFIQNPEQSQLSYQSTSYVIPVLFNAGCRWRPTSHFMLIVETEKQLERNLIYKTGIQFSFNERLFVRGGIKSNPVEMTFGGGVRFAGLFIDAGFAHHQQLGMTSGVGLSYSFNRKHR